MNQIATLRLTAEAPSPIMKIARDTPQIITTLTIKVCNRVASAKRSKRRVKRIRMTVGLYQNRLLSLQYGACSQARCTTDVACARIDCDQRHSGCVRSRYPAASLPRPSRAAIDCGSGPSDRHALDVPYSPWLRPVSGIARMLLAIHGKSRWRRTPRRAGAWPTRRTSQASPGRP